MTDNEHTLSTDSPKKFGRFFHRPLTGRQALLYSPFIILGLAALLLVIAGLVYLSENTPEQRAISLIKDASILPPDGGDKVPLRRLLTSDGSLTDKQYDSSWSAEELTDGRYRVLLPYPDEAPIARLNDLAWIVDLKFSSVDPDSYPASLLKLVPTGASDATPYLEYYSPALMRH